MHYQFAVGFQRPILIIWNNFDPQHGLVISTIIKCGWNYLSIPNFKVQPLKFGNEQVISSHTFHVLVWGIITSSRGCFFTLHIPIFMFITLELVPNVDRRSTSEHPLRCRYNPIIFSGNHHNRHTIVMWGLFRVKPLSHVLLWWVE